MNRQSLVPKVSIVFVAASLAALAAGCGGGGRANVTAESMPAGGSFTGVWHSQQYGEMQMVQTGTQVVGCYVQNERRGRIQGSTQGNLMRFEWSERREMVVGRPSTTRGHGYFQYTADDVDRHIVGQWGHDDNETGGGPWSAVRDRRSSRRPNPECTEGTADEAEPQGDSFESTEGGDSFDSGGGSGTSSDDGLGDI